MLLASVEHRMDDANPPAVGNEDLYCVSQDQESTPAAAELGSVGNHDVGRVGIRLSRFQVMGKRKRTNTKFSVGCDVVYTKDRDKASRLEDSRSTGDSSIVCNAEKDEVEVQYVPHYRTVPQRVDTNGFGVMDEWYTMPADIPNNANLLFRLFKHEGVVGSSNGVAIASVKLRADSVLMNSACVPSVLEMQNAQSTVQTAKFATTVVVPTDDDTDEWRDDDLSSSADYAHEHIDVDEVDGFDLTGDISELDASTSDSETNSCIDSGQPSNHDSLEGPDDPQSVDPTRHGDTSSSLARLWLDRTSHMTESVVIKTIFVVRHCESTWNVAMRKRNPAALLSRDHPLSNEGKRQCASLESRVTSTCDRASRGEIQDPGGIIGPWDAEQTLEARFAQAKAVYCSPLTRCVQTALMTLNGHPGAVKSGIVLHPALREVKGTLGVDCCSDLRGEEIFKNAITSIPVQSPTIIADVEDVHAELEVDDGLGNNEGDCGNGQLTEEDDVHPKSSYIFIDTSLTETPWSDRVGDTPKNSDLKARLLSFCRTLQYEPANEIILVTHSKLIMSLFRNFMSGATKKRTPELVRSLQNKKIPNGGVLGFEMLFNDPGPPKIISVNKLLYPDPENAGLSETDAGGKEAGEILREPGDFKDARLEDPLASDFLAGQPAVSSTPRKAFSDSNRDARDLNSSNSPVNKSLACDMM